MQRTKILVIGSLNVDLVIQVPRLPEVGETIMATSFRRYFGGKGAYQAVAAARQGADIIMAGRVGADNWRRTSGQPCAEELTPPMSSWTMNIALAWLSFLSAPGNNRIMVVAGANGAVGPTDIEALVPVMAACSCVLIQLEIPLDAALAAIRLANAQGAKVILDPAPAQSLPLSAYPHITVITPNAHEAQVLTGVPVHDLASAKAAQILWTAVHWRW